MRININNFRNSPAWLIEAKATFETLSKLTDLPEEPIYKDCEDYAKRGIVITSDDTTQIAVPHQPWTAPPDEMQQIMQKKLTRCLYVSLKYKDIFGEPRETRFSRISNDHIT